MSNKDVIVEISQPEIIVEVEQVEVVTDVVVGQKGDSAYKQAVDGGYTGTLEEFEAQLNDLPELTGGADTGLHKHDQMYYTETEVDEQMATKMNLDGSNSNIDTLTFKTTGQGTDPLPEGKMRWNSTDRTIDVGMDGSGVVQQVGMETFYPKCRNNDTVEIKDGELVMYDGAQGNSGVILVKRATTTMPLPGLAMGVATEHIPVNSEGRITWFGLIRGVQTDGANYGETWVDGTVLYNGATAGALSKVKPVAPRSAVMVGVVVNANPSNGILFVRPQYFPFLSHLSDVQITNPLNGQVLAYNSALGRWENITLDLSAKSDRLSATNLVTNGDFSNGTTGWVALRSTNVVDSNTLTNTADGSNPSPFAYQNYAFVSGRKYYIRARARVTNSVCQTLNVYLQSGSVTTGNLVPTANTWYNLSSAGTAGSDANIRIAHNYSDSATANGKVMEVQYVLVIDLTTVFGAGNEPTATEMDALLTKFTNAWFNGTNYLADLSEITKLGSSVIQNSTEANAKIEASSTGSVITRNVNDANPPLIVNKQLGTGNIARFQLGGTTKVSINDNGYVYLDGLAQTASSNNASLQFSTGGSTIYRNIADANPALKVNQQNASSTGNIAEFQKGGVSYCIILPDGRVQTTSLVNLSSPNNATVGVATTGVLVERNIADANSCLKVNQKNASSTGNIAEFQFNGTTKLAIDKNGLIAQEAWITPTLANTGSGTVQYRKNKFGRVEFRGTITQTDATNSPFNIPVGYRPQESTRFAIPATDNAIGSFIVGSGGDIFLPSSNKTYALSGLSYVVD